MRLSDIVMALDRACPAALAEDWDNVGLVLGDPEADVDRILVALDPDMPAIDRAAALGADLLVTHHPLTKGAPASLASDDPDGRRVAAAIKADLAILAMHTNFDAVGGGVSDVLARRLDLADISVLVPRGDMRKVVVFVPQEHAEGVFAAMTEAGAGRIGAYRECSFQVAGRGTFAAPPDSSPAVGDAGRANTADEIRIETSVPAESVGRVVAAMVAQHPYEEVAYDVYALEGARTDVGLGRIGQVLPLTLAEFASTCARKLGVSTVKYSGPAERRVRRVAVCGGSGGSLIDAAMAKGADVFVAGDIRYHDAQRAVWSSMGVVDAGHDCTEAPALGALAGLVEEALRPVGYTGSVEVHEADRLWRATGGADG